MVDTTAEWRLILKEKNNTSACSVKRTSIGGQALIEGIMMRGPKYSAMAVKNPDGEIVLEKWENPATQDITLIIFTQRSARYSVLAVASERLWSERVILEVPL